MVFSVDVTSTVGACTITASLVSFTGTRTCAIDANQAGDANHSAAPQVTQRVTIAKAAQAINFTSTPPANPTVGAQYLVTATGGLSGNPVVFSADSSSTLGACAVTGAGAVAFIGTGICVIDANQPGDTHYLVAAQVTQSVTVAKAAQTITFTSTPPSPATVGGTHTPTVTGGGSNLPVIFSVDATSSGGTCTITAAAVSFSGAGTCVIDANQPGNANYLAAPQVSQTIMVGKTPKPSADLKVTFTGPVKIRAGVYTTTVTVTDNGPSTATSIVTGLTVTNGLTVTAAPGGTIIARGAVVAYSTASLAGGKSVAFTVTLSSVSKAHGTQRITATAASLTVADPDHKNNVVTTTITLP